MTAQHNIPPVYDQSSRILILGSFPSVKSREGQFFYHHPQNRFWQVLAAVLGCPVPSSIEEKKAMLIDHGIALWDVIASCEITGSSDSSIRGAVPNDLGRIVKDVDLQAVFCNGQTAFRLYRRFLAPSLSLPAAVLPSTSPANAAWPLARLVETWAAAIAPYL